MLSRLANRVYWLSRYMERAGNTAKTCNAYANLLLDLPAGTEIGWHTLVTIHGADRLFSELYSGRKEDDVMDFLLFDERNPASVYSSVCFARENARTSRDILPSETWEIVNSLYLNMKSLAADKVSRSKRSIVMSNVMHNVMRLEGMLNSGLSRNNTNRFIQIGRNLERADTTTRVLDVGSVLLTEGRSSLLRCHEGVVWMYLLRSMNSYQMYRQEVKRKVVGEDVVRFLVFDKCFPRSVTFCTDQIKQYAWELNSPEKTLRTVACIEKELENFSPEVITAEGISSHMDEIQKMLCELNQAVEETWFNTNKDI